MQHQRLGRSTSFVRNLLANLGHGFEAALLLRVDPGRLATSWLLMAAALILWILPPLVSQWLELGAEGEFYGYGLQGVWFPFAVIFIATALAGRLFALEERVRPLLLLMLNTYLAIDIVNSTLIFILGRFAPGSYHWRTLCDVLPGYWLGLAFAVLLIRMRPARRAPAVPAAFGLGVAICFAINTIWGANTLWSLPYDADQTQQDRAEYNAAVAEDVLYLQPKLLAGSLAGLAAGPAGTANLYFLGVAGDAQQRVFQREVNSVERLFLQRYTEPSRSILLINSRDTLRSAPIATAIAIKESIDTIGRVMDRDNDILFIYLTSHGSETHRFSLNFPPLQLSDLQPAQLREMLDAAGIQWRVIVVSACYSGGFIAPLANEKTLVVTAAAADKASFGCADENDFTYFGRAYFADALQKTGSFIDAFGIAKALVKEREQAEEETPSEPQIAVGSEIAAKLQVFEDSRPRH